MPGKPQLFTLVSAEKGEIFMAGIELGGHAITYRPPIGEENFLFGTHKSSMAALRLYRRMYGLDLTLVFHEVTRTTALDLPA
ncbi:hypothetical protein [Amycolatopsis samaneae]|uniref:Uncharacterized protein n=1 Tax=Amycolatopsis samaneae TaxID=664691 RepID=A0ABW5GH45_9PSEU